MGKLFRFELAFDGEPQGVGFLQGLDDVGLWSIVRDELYSLFDSLPICELDEPDGVSFWFTEAGLRKYEGAINRVSNEITEEGWQLIGAVIDDSLEDVLYRDDFQAAFPLECIRMMDIQYVPIFDVNELLDSIS